MGSPSEDQSIPLRIVVVDPPAGVVFALQRGRSELVAVTRSSGQPITFDFEVRARRTDTDAAVNLLGPFTQGSPGRRFVYINSGTYAGDAGSNWGRRAKVPLGDIGARLVEELQDTRGSRLQATIPGRAKDGGPVCASVRLLEPGWTVVQADYG